MIEIDVKLTENVQRVLNDALSMSQNLHHEYVTPEHTLLTMSKDFRFLKSFDMVKTNFATGLAQLCICMMKMEMAPKERHIAPRPSAQLEEMLQLAYKQMTAEHKRSIGIVHILEAIRNLPESYAAYVLNSSVGQDLWQEFIKSIEFCYDPKNGISEQAPVDDAFDDDNLFDDDDDYDDDYDEERMPHDWHQLVTCITDKVDQHNPLIGRCDEMERTIQVLCRADKNNPLHVGEPGVGKTALVYGLAEWIRNETVPDRLLGARIYAMDMGQMLAGAQYRGDFEKRLKMVMEGAKEEGNCIIYLDEIHNIMGAGKGSDGGPDAANILKPYLESGDIRFIGSTTYEEYNRHIAKNKGIVRRFQQIDILEPTEQETLEILRHLVPRYQKFHHVTYRREAVEYAVHASAKYISNRCLPDKAIDLLDEAGAYLEVNPPFTLRSYVTKTLIKEILMKVCKIQASVLKDENNETLGTLMERMLSEIYGQDEAVKEVVEAVMMAKAGLTDDDKPLASLLFVGPTGVGKTEVAKSLAKELGIELVRFDMSEYTEKHTVAKLIGSPAGYVGYEDGGLLTDAIRKTPNCVLLLDEIEKAHSDIYNILLQVMDYARLTDNRGQKADFRNVILIMTSNAGAQYASQANVGFNGKTTRGEAMLQQVKKTFKPEFLNRLSGTVVFHDMNKHMAELILQKKLRLLEKKLSSKKVSLDLTPAAIQQLLEWGFTKEYGAREMDRVINNRLKPLLMRQILFGNLRKGGKAKMDFVGGKLALNV